MMHPPASSFGALVAVSTFFASSSVLALRSPSKYITSWNPAGRLLPHPATECPLTRDDRMAEDDDDEWPYTHHPSCVHAGRNPFNLQGQPICVYTSQAFRGQEGHGISMLTFPSVASAVYQAFSSAPGDVWDEPEKSEILPGPVHDDKGNPIYQVRDVPGKGKGVVALRHIKKGEAIAHGWPAILAHIMMPRMLSQRRGEDMIDLAVEQLGKQQEEKILGLARRGQGRAVEDVMRTNIFGVEVGGQSHTAIFPELSRINHACDPNAFFKFSQNTLIMEVLAFKDIKAGEEILISYSKLSGTTEERKAHLHRIYGFNCNCSFCNRPREKRMASDARRTRLREIREKLMANVEMEGGHRLLQMEAVFPVLWAVSPSIAADPATSASAASATSTPASSLPPNNNENTTAGPTPEEIDQLSQELVHMLRWEGLDTQMGYYYEVLTRATLSIGDMEGAKRWAEKALEAWLLWESEDDGHVVDARAFLRELERLRVGM